MTGSLHIEALSNKMAEGQTEFDFVKPKHDSESRLKPSAREQQTVFEAKSSIFCIFFLLTCKSESSMMTISRQGFRHELITGAHALSTRCKSERLPAFVLQQKTDLRTEDEWRLDKHGGRRHWCQMSFAEFIRSICFVTRLGGGGRSNLLVDPSFVRG